MHRAATGGFAEHHYIVGVAAEGRDVLAHPFERSDLVHIAVIAVQSVRILCGQRREAEKSETAETIIEADEDNAVLREMRAVIDGRRGTAIDEAAAVNPDHDRQLLRGIRRTPDVQIEAILAGRRAQRRSILRERLLHAVMGVGFRLAHARPGGSRLRRRPAQLADRRRGIGNALEVIDGAAVNTDKRAIGDRHFGHSGRRPP